MSMGPDEDEEKGILGYNGEAESDSGADSIRG